MFTESEKDFAFSTITKFKEIWEKLEREALIKDRDRKLRLIDIEKEWMDTESAKVMEEEEKYIEEYLAIF